MPFIGSRSPKFKRTYTKLSILDESVLIGRELEFVTLVRFDHKVSIDRFRITFRIRFYFNERMRFQFVVQIRIGEP